jgi:succinate-semialdehyde dehydrogenase/glutarate-semialdehyde dehydrogenase
MYDAYGLLIDNQWRPAASGRTMAVYSPATEEKIGEVPSASPEDVAAVLASAVRGFAAWKATPAWTRARVMRKASDLIRERVETIARIMSTETGKPLAEARGEIGAAAEQFEWYAEEAKRV